MLKPLVCGLVLAALPLCAHANRGVAFVHGTGSQTNALDDYWKPEFVNSVRQGLPNQQLDGRRLDDHLAAEPAALTFLQGVARRLGWSARSLHRCLRVARTVADLRGADQVTTSDVAEAVQDRRVLQTGS